jgi:RHS repeat-associated protein
MIMKLVFAYDYLGRRIEKQVFDWDDQAADWQASPSVQRKFVWGGTEAGGWLMLMELDGSDNLVRKYTWGLDLAGQSGSGNSLADAGGIGGLLAVAQAQLGGGSASGGVDAGDYVFTCDANGNVAQVLDLSAGSAAAAIVAHYEYDPYGGVVNDLSGYTYAEANPIRFSTKYHDAETGLGYWGYRYYSARLGRWLSRDPIGEAGFRVVQRAAALTGFIPRDTIRQQQHLYSHVSNTPTNRVDPLGLQDCCKCGPNITHTIADHLTAFVSQKQGDLSWFWPSGARACEPDATANGTTIFDASQQATKNSGCGQGPCAGTVTLCDLCISGYHIRHILIMVYIAESYGVKRARSAGQYNESFGLGAWHEGGRFTGSGNPISNADLTFNEVALCLAEAMKHADANGGVTDPLTVSEICACTKRVTPQQRADIANKPGYRGRNTGYDKCQPCGVSVPTPPNLRLPPIDL